MLKPKDTVKRSCQGCLRRHRCNPGLFDKSQGTIRRINPFVDKGFDVEGPYSNMGTAVTKCSGENLKKIEKEPVPYWGIHQNDPIKPDSKPGPVAEAPSPATAAPTIGDFGYGSACSLCRATQGENHASSCQLEGALRLDE